MVSGDLHDLGEGTANQYLTLEYESLSCDELCSFVSNLLSRVRKPDELCSFVPYCNQNGLGSGP